MRAKTIEKMDNLIEALEELKEALELETSKSGDSADDEDSGTVSRSKRKTSVAKVPASGKKSKVAADDEDEGDDAGDDEDEELPKARSAGKGKTVAKGKAKKPAADEDEGDDAGDDDSTEEEDEGAPIRAAIRKILRPHMEDAAFKKKVTALLKKFKAGHLDEVPTEKLAAVKKEARALAAAAEDGDE